MITTQSYQLETLLLALPWAEAKAKAKAKAKAGHYVSHEL